MNVILVNPPIRLPRVFAHYPMSSTLGLLTNAAFLRASGMTVRVVDALTDSGRLNLRADGGDYRHVGAEVEQLAARVEAAVADAAGTAVVIVSVTMFSDLNRAHETLVPATVEALRRRLARTALGLADLHIGGMNYFPYDPPKALAAMPGADWIAVGEGEPTLPALIDALGRGQSLAGMPRIAWRDADGEIHYDARAPEPHRDLDALPPPAYDLLDMEKYFAVQAEAIRADLVHEYHVVERQLPLMTSRGCPYRCNFCTNQVMDLPWRPNSVERLKAILQDLRERYGVDRFLFLDDNICVDEERLRALATWLADEGIAWDAVNGFRADLLDRDIVRAIKRAGNTKITVSAESGDPQILRGLIKKGLKLPKVIELARICAEERIALQVHYIVGMPGETKTQINKTLEFATVLFEQHGAWPLLQHAIPFPGTAMFRDCEDKGLFVAPPFSIPGEVLEQHGIIRTPEFEPGEVVRMKRNAQHLHASLQALCRLEVEVEEETPSLAHPVPSADAPARATLAELEGKLDWASFRGGREVFLAGGEPTRRPDLADVVRLARAKGFRSVALVSDASGLADAERAEPILAAGIDRLIVELHGADAATHDAVAGAPGAFERCLGGVERAKSHSVPIEILAAVTRRNLGALDALVRFAVQLGARKVHLEYPAPDTRAAAAGQVAPWPEARPALFRALAAGTRGLVALQGVPFCLERERPGAIHPVPPWVLARTRRLKMRHPTCTECPAFLLCGGFYAQEHQAAYAMMPASEARVGAPAGGA